MLAGPFVSEGRSARHRGQRWAARAPPSPRITVDGREGPHGGESRSQADVERDERAAERAEPRQAQARARPQRHGDRLREGDRDAYRGERGRDARARRSTSSAMPAAQRCVSGATSASSASGAASSGTHQVGHPGQRSRPSRRGRASGCRRRAARDRRRRRRPARRAHGSPGSASEPPHVAGAQLVPDQRRGEAAARARRTQIEPRDARVRARSTTASTIAPTHTTTSAGASDGAQATHGGEQEGCRARRRPTIDARPIRRRRATAAGGAR